MDAYEAEKFAMAAPAATKGKEGVALDLGRLSYISSSGLNAIIGLRNALQREGRRLVLLSLKGKVLEVFRISKLCDIFEIRESLEDASKK